MIESTHYSFHQQSQPRTLHKKVRVWKYVLNKESIYNNDEFLSVFRVTRSTFKRIVSLVKENPVLQGQTSEKQYPSTLCQRSTFWLPLIFLMQRGTKGVQSDFLKRAKGAFPATLIVG